MTIKGYLKILTVSTAMLAAGIATGQADAALTVGDILEVQYLFPTEANVIETSGTFAYTGAGQSILTQGGISTVSLFDNSITFAESPGCGSGCTQTGADFNGPLVINYTNLQAFAGWSLLSDTAGITSAVLEPNRVGVNWQGAAVQGAAVIGVSAVPEPATWALLIGGFGMVGGTMRRRRVSTVVRFA